VLQCPLTGRVVAADSTRWQRMLPTALTMLRLALVPVLMALFLVPGFPSGPRLWATGVVLIASVTDLLDGALARRWRVTSRLGEVLDPIADKAIVAVALIGMSAWHLLPWWVTALILGRELGVTLLRWLAPDPRSLLSGRWAKVKTVLQMVAICALLLPLGGAWPVLAGLTMAAAVVLTLITGGDYAVRAVQQISARRR